MHALNGLVKLSGSVNGILW